MSPRTVRDAVREHRACGGREVAGGARQLVRVRQRLARAADVAEIEQRAPEREQQAGVGAGDRAEREDRAVERRDRLLVRALHARVIGGGDRPCERGLRVDVAVEGVERALAALVDANERARDAAVRGGDPAVGCLALDRLAEQVVAEPPAIGAGLVDDAARDDRARAAAHRLGRHAGRGGPAIERDVATDGGRRIEQLAHRRRQQREALTHDRRDAGRDREPRDGPGDDARRRRARAEPGERLEQEQRVPAGRAGERRAQLGGRVGAHLVDQLADLARVEPREREQRRLARDPRDRVADQLPRGLRIAPRRDPQDARAAQVLRRERRELERRQVRGVEIVEHAQQRRLRRCLAQSRGHRFEQLEARLIRIGRGGVALAPQLPERRIRRSLRKRLEQQAPRPVRGRAAGLPRASPARHEAGRARTLGDRERQSRLADAGLADQRERGRAPGHGRVEPARHRRQLDDATVERARGHALRFIA